MSKNYTWMNQGPWGRAEVYVCMDASSLPPDRQRRVGKPAYGEAINLSKTNLPTHPMQTARGAKDRRERVVFWGVQ